MSDLVAVLSADSSQLQKALNDAKSVLNNYKKEADKTSLVSEKQIEVFNKSVNALNKLSNSGKSALQLMKGLENHISSLSTQYTSLSDEVKRSDFGKALANTIQNAVDRFKELEDTTGKVKEALHSNSEESKNAKDVLGKLSDMVGVNIGTLAKFGGALGVGKFALDELKQAVFLNESAIDEWGRTVKGAEAAHNTFLHALNSGNWSNFFSNLETAIKGARLLYNEFDRLGSIKANNAAAIALVDAELAQLRKLKKEGKDVQKQIDNAVARRGLLVQLGVVQGLHANRSGMIQTLKQYNPRMSDSAALKTADNVLKYGLKMFDSADATVLRLEKIATKIVTTTDAYGYKHTQKIFNIDRLTPIQLQLYRNAKALKESETQLLPYISGHAEATREGTANTIADIKLTPKLSGGKTTKTTRPPKEEDKLEQLIARFLRSTRLYIPLDYLPEQVKTEKPKETSPMDRLKELGVDIPEIKDIEPIKISDNSIESYQLKIESLRKTLLGLDMDSEAYRATLANLTDAENTFNSKIKGSKNRTLKLSDSMGDAANYTSMLAGALSDVGSATNNVGLNIATVMALAIALVVGAYALTLALDLTTKGNIWAFIAAAAASTISMAATISSMKAAGSYADGGIILGKTSIGDYNWAKVNGGEMILNGSQLHRLFNLLNTDGGYGVKRGNTDYIEFKIKGSTLVGALKNYYRKKSRL